MRKAVREIEGVMAVMAVANVNTDAIIPSAWMRTAKADLAKGLFGGLRYDEAGRERLDFVLNRPPFRQAAILLADENFGCGSSREAAVWALAQFGIRCVLAPSFADIFYENAFRNALLPGVIAPDTLPALADCVRAHLERPIFHIDISTGRITGPDGSRHAFHVPPPRAEALIEGHDEIDMTLRHASAIDAYYAETAARRGWLLPRDGLRGADE